MFATDIEAFVRSQKLILVGCQVRACPPELSLADCERWNAQPANRIVCKTYFLEGSIEVSTVFLPHRTYNDRQFETIVMNHITDEDSDEYRWKDWVEAWIAHLMIAIITDLQVLKLCPCSITSSLCQTTVTNGVLLAINQQEPTA